MGVVMTGSVGVVRERFSVEAAEWSGVVVEVVVRARGERNDTRLTVYELRS